MYMCVLICACLYVRAYMCLYNVSKYHQAILHHIDAFRAFTLCAKHVTFKVHGSIFLVLVLWTHNYVISIQEYVIAQVVHTTASVLSGDCCKVFLLYRMYEGVETAVIIWCGHQARWPLLGNAWVSVFSLDCCICIYISIPINVGTVIVSFINN